MYASIYTCKKFEFYLQIQCLDPYVAMDVHFALKKKLFYVLKGCEGIAIVVQMFIQVQLKLKYIFLHSTFIVKKNPLFYR
jgi:hypothetical protein